MSAADKILVTGATGQLGRLTVPLLAKRLPTGILAALVRDPAKAADLAAARRAGAPLARARALHGRRHHSVHHDHRAPLPRRRAAVELGVPAAVGERGDDGGDGDGPLPPRRHRVEGAGLLVALLVAPILLRQPAGRPPLALAKLVVVPTS